MVGEKYETLTKKLMAVLRTASNLYIWTKLDENKDYSECCTASHLIEEWWRQLKTRSMDDGINENDVINVKELLVNRLDSSGKLSAPRRSLRNINEGAVYYLATNGFLIVEDNKISFIHQSILDYFLSELMMGKYYNGEEITNIIGDRSKQTPGRRYQVQMLLENLLEDNSEDFINAGKEIINSNEIRFYVKHVFYEVLGQVAVIDNYISSYVLDQCKKENNLIYIINNVIMGRKKFIDILRDNGVLDIWMKNTSRKDTVFNLFWSIDNYIDEKDVEFIKRYIFKSETDDRKFLRCFSYDFSRDTEAKFGLRMMLYEKYPDEANIYIDLKQMIKKCEIRTIKYIVFLLKVEIQRKNIFKREEDIVLDDLNIDIVDYRKTLDILLPFIPQINERESIFSNWNNKDGYKNNLQRICVRIIRKANQSLINDKPELFVDLYKIYMGKGYPVFNEIILDALEYLPEKYSDFVINYLSDDINKNIFDKTSPNKDELYLAKKAIKKHSRTCSNKVYISFEEKIMKYISPDAKDLYKRRVRWNKTNKNGGQVYWSFWGDLQFEILSWVSEERITKQAKDLLMVLRRKFNGKSKRYLNPKSEGGWVKSAISGKKLSDKQWVKLLTNNKIQYRKDHSWKEVKGGVIENSVEEFASDFLHAVANEPERMIKLILKNKDRVLDNYINALYSGIFICNSIKNISESYLEKVLMTFQPKDNKSLIAGDFCEVIEKRPDINWNKKIMNLLKNIAINHMNPQIDQSVVTTYDEKEMKSFSMLQSNAINCTRGRAAFAISKLIWHNSDLYLCFKETIEKLTLDESPEVQFASLSALWPVYNIDREWAAEKILCMYEHDIRFVGYPDSKNMLFRLYELNDDYKIPVKNVIKKCFSSDDDELIRIGGQALAEMYILNNEFIDEMNNIISMSEKQVQSILEMVMLYFAKDEYNQLAKEIILKLKECRFDLEYPLGDLFRENMVDLARDKDFLLEIMSANVGGRVISDLVEFLENDSKSVVEFRGIILSVSRAVINKDLTSQKGYWGVEDEISKLIIGLYDETSSATVPELKDTANKCLDIWDEMFEKQIGSVRQLSQEILER